MRSPFRMRWTSTVLSAGVLVGSVAVAVPRAAALVEPPKEPVYATKTFAAAGGEPGVSISPDGRTVLVDGLARSTVVYRSADGGATFTRLTVNVPEHGDGDWDMRWIDDHTIVAADLSLGTGIYVNRSTNGGLTWTQTTINEDVYDRPWLAVAGNKVYVIAKGFDGIPYCYISTDGGATFGQVPVPIYGTGAVPAQAGGQSPTPADLLSTQNAYIDHAVTDPTTGDLYVLFGIDGQDTYSQTYPFGTPSRLYVAHLVQGVAGAQFDVHAVYLGGQGDNFINGFNWMTIDANGTIYVLGNGDHAGHQSGWLFVSKDHGATWSTPVDIGEPSGTNVYGSIAAGAPGNLALVYLHGPQSTPGVAQDWHAKVAQISNADTSQPSVNFLVDPLGLAIHTADICMDGILCGAPGFGDNRDLLDYISNAVAPDGNSLAVVASDGPATGSGSVSVVLIRQVDGPNVGPGVPS